MFPVITADPPWPFDDTGSRVSPENEGCAAGYSTMSVDDIASLGVSGISAPDAVLFLWTTATHILDGSATKVAKAWGFTPKTIVPWIKLSDTPRKSSARWKDDPSVEWVYRHGLKIQIGNGHYVRNCSEPLVIAVRGSMTVHPSLRMPGIIVATRSRHSEKPACVRDWIESLYPGHRYLELFARDAPIREKWSFLGDQK